MTYSQPWRVYAIADVLKMNSIDSSIYGELCGYCDEEMCINYTGEGCFTTYCVEQDCENYNEVTTFTIEDILSRKREDEWYEVLVESLQLDVSRPQCRIVGETIFDGHHRLAALIDLGFKYIVAEQIPQPVWDDDFHNEHVYY